MKKLLTFAFLFLLTFTLVGCGKKDKPVKPDPVPPIIDPTPDPKPDPEPDLPWIDENEPLNSKHLILDEYGNYGGTTNKSKYGMGTPLNGELDIENSEYYLTRDYYYAKSTPTRTMFSKFRPYQQTMQDSGGIACVLMALNYLGADVFGEFNEVNLVEKYEALNNTKVFGNGTDTTGLIKLVNSTGYRASSLPFVESGSNNTERIQHFSEFVQGEIKKGNIILLRYHDTMEYGWHVIVGIDNMGTTPYSRDDVLIMADPFDNSDHCQDGYYAMPAGRVYRWWQDVDDSGIINSKFDGFMINIPNFKGLDTATTDEYAVKPEVPELHLLLNEDGSYGGTRDAIKYGVIEEKNGQTDHKEAGYYLFPDYYNMKSTETRTILTNYRAFQQTMASSCGICSTLSVLHYYGDLKNAEEVHLVNEYERINNATIKGKGVGSGGLLALVESMGYTGERGSYSRDSFKSPEESMCFPTYESFIAKLVPLLKAGTPLPISMRPLGGHWEVVIGYDSMGTENIYDDIIVLADSHDTQDHYQDGYNTYSAVLFFRQWYNGSFTYNQQHYYFANNK